MRFVDCCHTNFRLLTADEKALKTFLFSNFHFRSATRPFTFTFTPQPPSFVQFWFLISSKYCALLSRVHSISFLLEMSRTLSHELNSFPFRLHFQSWPIWKKLAPSSRASFLHLPLHHRFKFGSLLFAEKVFRAARLVEPPALDQWEASSQILLFRSADGGRAPVSAARGVKEQCYGATSEIRHLSQGAQPLTRWN